MTHAKEPFLIRHAAAVFSAKTFLASVLALLIALWLDLPRPYWAMATVYVTSHPLAGATNSKALYRVVGTLVGAVVAVALVPALIDAPELLILAIALWTGVCVYLSLLDGTPRAYIFLLAGYTVGLIAFPSVSEPAAIFDTAVARVEEITLGILCASLVSALVAPRSVAAAVATRVSGWLADVQALARGILLAGGARAKRLQPARDIVEIDALMVHLAHEGGDRNALEGLRELRLRMLMFLPVIASVGDRLTALAQAPFESPQLAQLLASIAQWLVQDSDLREDTVEVKAGVAARRTVLRADAGWDQILTANLAIRLDELIDLTDDCLLLNTAIVEGRPISALALAVHPEGGAAEARHRDHVVALWSATGTAVATVVCCAFWIATGWEDGATAAMMACVSSALFAAQDVPTRGILSFGLSALVAIVVVAFYIFAVIPAISDVEILVACLAPAFLVIGYLAGNPTTAGFGGALGVNAATLLAVQQTYSADFAAYTNSALSFLGGVVIAVAVTSMVRGAGVAFVAGRVLRSNRKTLVSAIERRGKQDRAGFAGLMLHRLALLAQRLAFVSQSERSDAFRLTQLRIGLNIIDLRRTRHGLSRPTVQVLDEMFDAMAAALRNASRDVTAPDLLERIDAALAFAMKDEGASAREDAVVGLVGLRRGLFPDAPAYQPPSQERRAA